MVDVKFGDLLEEQIQNDSIIPFENDTGLTKRDIAIAQSLLSLGTNYVPIFTEADFPAPVGGFIRLENGKKYVILAPTAITSPFLLEAGVEVIIESSFPLVNSIAFSSFSGTAIQTLNLDGSITAFADSPTSPGAKTEVTSAAHGLSENDKVNIFNVDTQTQYNITGATVTNVTANTFDIDVVFGATDTGDFDTGLASLTIDVFTADGTGPGGTLQAFDLTYTSTSPGTAFNVKSAIFNFDSLGIVRDAAFCSLDGSLMVVNTAGLVLDNVVSSRVSFTTFFSLDGTSAATALTIQGSATTNLDMLTSPFNLASGAAFPIKINTDIDALATIKIANCSATDTTTVFFDPSGVNQTDVRMDVVNSIPSPNSQSMSESRTNLVLVVDGSGGTDVPIVDITPVAGDWIEDATTEEWIVDTTTGLHTYIGRDPKSVTAKYELEAAQNTGANQSLIFDLHFNGASQPKTIRTIDTMGAGSFVPVSYIGGSFNIVNGDTFQLFKDNITNASNTDITDATILINKNG